MSIVAIILLILLCLIISLVIIKLFNRPKSIVIGGGKVNLKEIFIVRHAQTDMNKAGKYYDNHTHEDDVDINETGIQQAITTGKYLKKFKPFDLVIASPRKRTMHTAELIANQIGYKKPIITSELLFETKKGIFNGMTGSEYDDIYMNDPDIKSIFDIYNSISDSIERNLYWNTHVKKLDEVRGKKFQQSSFIEQDLAYEQFIAWLLKRKEFRILIVCHSGSEKGLLSLMTGIMPMYLPKAKTTDDLANCTVSYLQYGKSPMTQTESPKFFLVSNSNNMHLKNI